MSPTSRIPRAWSVLLLAPAVSMWLSAAPAAAQGARPTQDSGPAREPGGGRASGGGAAAGGGGGSTSTPSGGSSSSGGSASGGSSSGGGGYSGGSGARRDGGTGRSGATGGGGYAVPRGERSSDAGPRSGGAARDSSGASTGSGATERSPSTSGGTRDQAVGRDDGSGRAGRTLDDGDSGVPAYARPRDGRDSIGTAVPRGTVPMNPPGGGGGLIIPGYYPGGGYYGGYYDPWWYGAGYIGSYGGYYDPWYGGYPSGPQTSSSSTYDEEGKLRLKIKPRDAEVYVDGYFVGTVDDFDGMFQRLHLETGAHRIEVRAAGYEPLMIDVRITPEHTTTYQGELKRIQ